MAPTASSATAATSWPQKQLRALQLVQDGATPQRQRMLPVPHNTPDRRGSFVIVARKHQRSTQHGSGRCWWPKGCRPSKGREKNIIVCYVLVPDHKICRRANIPPYRDSSPYTLYFPYMYAHATTFVWNSNKDHFVPIIVLDATFVAVSNLTSLIHLVHI